VAQPALRLAGLWQESQQAAIAQVLGVTPVTVRWHLSIGRREMAKALGKARND